VEAGNSLASQPTPFGELRQAIPDITQHMLTAKLRELEVDGLVSRTVFAPVPPRVDYAITERARASVNL
jgi:DNA-binding HxlR family transcriptional regulator